MAAQRDSGAMDTNSQIIHKSIDVAIRIPADYSRMVALMQRRRIVDLARLPVAIYILMKRMLLQVYSKGTNSKKIKKITFYTLLLVPMPYRFPFSC